MGRFTVAGVAFCIFVCFAGPFIGNWLPNVVSSEEFFCETRALEDLAELSQKIGTRAGSQSFVINETRHFIQRSISAFIPYANSNGWNLTIENITVEGRYYWKSQHFRYKNLHHLLVRLEPFGYDQNTCKGSLLVNTHIDSAVSSPGAGDDGIAVVIVLESIRLLIKNPPASQTSPVTFLFNNGEELGLLGSHGFVTNFPDKIHDFGAFINLEAAGTYGPENLFQASNNAPWLIEEYAAAAPYPRGSIVAQDLFQAGVIPSDTDYRVFTREGNLTGIDMALYRNGYLYHTPKDSFEHISPGTLQHFGSNVLSLIRRIITNSGSNLRKTTKTCLQPLLNTSTQTTFFDFGGLFMIHYNDQTNITLIIILGTGVLWNFFRIRNFRLLSLTSLSVIIVTVLSTAFSILLPLFFGYIVSEVIGKPLLWFSSPLLALLLYFPLAISGIILSVLMTSFIPCDSKKKFTELFFLLNSLLCFILVLIGYYFYIGATFFVIIYSACFCVASVLCSSKGEYFLFSLPLFLISDLCFQFLETIVPIAGRAGLKPVELIISGFCGIIGVFVLIPFLPLFRFKLPRKKMALVSTGLILFSSCVVFILALQTSVYTVHAPKRVLVEHLNTLGSDESYFLFIPADGIPFRAEDLPKDSFPQPPAYTRKFHSKLPTIPCLNPDQGRRWEMPANPPSLQTLPTIDIVSVDQAAKIWKIQIFAPKAFSTEILISPSSHILECDLIQVNSTISSPDDQFKVRLFDGDGKNEFEFRISLSTEVKVDFFINYLEDNPSAPINKIIKNLPKTFTPVGSVTFHKTILLK